WWEKIAHRDGSESLPGGWGNRPGGGVEEEKLGVLVRGGVEDALEGRLQRVQVLVDVGTLVRAIADAERLPGSLALRVVRHPSLMVGDVGFGEYVCRDRPVELGARGRLVDRVGEGLLLGCVRRHGAVDRRQRAG